jgi:hypothetical protein
MEVRMGTNFMSGKMFHQINFEYSVLRFFIWNATCMSIPLFKLTDSMELSLISSASQLSELLWNPKFDYSVHMSLPLDPILSQMNPIHILTP